MSAEQQVKTALRRVGWTLGREVPVGAMELARCVTQLGGIAKRGRSWMPDGDSRRAPVILVHGFLSVPKQLDAWAEAAGESAHAYRFSYPSIGVPLDEVAERLALEIERIAARHRQPVTLVGHSLGGVLIRAAIEGRDVAHLVRACVTVCSPHGEVPTVVRRFGEVVRRERLELRLEAPVQARTIAVTAGEDVVVPPESAMLVGAETLHIADAGHFTVINHPRVLQLIGELAAG
jgi:triacylglycerol esterase/lipase EstA (alpha/beta hydrolase family)